MTRDLFERISNHKNKKYLNSFSARYNTHKLVYYELLDTIGEAIKREKQIKGGSRKKKVDLINAVNPEWNDLSLILNEIDGLLRPPSSSSQ